MTEIGITKVLPGEDKIGIQLSGSPEFFNGMIPVPMQRVGVAEVVVRPRLVGRFRDRVGPEPEPVVIELVSLNGEEAENDDHDSGHCSPSGWSETRSPHARHEPLNEMRSKRNDRN